MANSSSIDLLDNPIRFAVESRMLIGLYKGNHHFHPAICAPGGGEA